jgi:dTDP-4-amino-4,6-dideoxygalactose transaminase
VTGRGRGEPPGRELSLSDPILGAEETRALGQVIESGWITMGETVRRFEEHFGQAQGIEQAVAVSSATGGIHLSLAALGLGPGDEVLVPSLTFVASANAIRYTGATPVFVDIESIERPHISLPHARERLTPRTRAVVVVHYGGWLCPMEEWRAFADEHRLALVEDAAHVPGMPGVGTYSDAAVYSFYGNKNMTTAEGGMVVTRHVDLAARVRRLRSHGMTTLTWDRYAGHAYSYDVTDLGFNYRMDELRAALGLVQLARLPTWNRQRSALLDCYREKLDEASIGAALPFEPEKPTAGHLCPVLLPEGTDRDAVMRMLRAAGVHSSVHYPPTHLFSLYHSGSEPSELPRTEMFAGRELSLPLHPGLSEEDVDFVVAKLDECLCQYPEATD